MPELRRETEQSDLSKAACPEPVEGPRETATHSPTGSETRHAVTSPNAPADLRAIERPRWEIDRRLEALSGHNVRVRAQGFCPAIDKHPFVDTHSLILPDGSALGHPLYFEGTLVSFVRRVAVVYVTLDQLSEVPEPATGLILFRGTAAVILQGPATVRLSAPFSVERVPEDPQAYWSDLLQPDPQRRLRFPD